jgi:hypothetical protein
MAPLFVWRLSVCGRRNSNSDRIGIQAGDAQATMSDADVLRKEDTPPVATPSAPEPDEDLDEEQPPSRPSVRASSPPAPTLPPSMAGEQFNLRWNDFHESLARSLCSMRDDEDFVDVTLVCEDGQHVDAHRIVLSACSDYFRRVLRKASVSSSRRLGANPVLVLCGIAFPELQQILRFMYHGEVQVHQEKLQAFLAVAERLQVRCCSSGLLLAKCQFCGRSVLPSARAQVRDPRPGGPDIFLARERLGEINTST